MGKGFSSTLLENIWLTEQGRELRYPADYDQTGVSEVIDDAEKVARLGVDYNVLSEVVIAETVRKGNGFGSQAGTMLGPVVVRGWNITRDVDNGHIVILDRKTGSLWAGLPRNPRKYGDENDPDSLLIAVAKREVMQLHERNFLGARASRARGNLGAIAISSGLARFVSEATRPQSAS